MRKQVIIRFRLAALLIPVVLYALAGTLHYWQGWLYWMVLLVPMLAAVIYFLKADPELLERRMKFQEREREQQTIVLMGTLAFVAGFTAIAIDLRLHGLNMVPNFFVLAANAVVFLGYCLILWVLKENSYASRTIEVMEGQEGHNNRSLCHYPPPHVFGFPGHVSGNADSTWLLVGCACLLAVHPDPGMADFQ